MFELNATLVIFQVSFLLFMLALNEVFLKPVGAIIEKRNAKIRADNEAAKESRAKAQEVLSDYESSLRQIREDAQKVINDAATAAQSARNSKVRELEEQGRKKLEEAKKAIAAEKMALVDSLVAQEIEIVQTIAHKLTGEPVAITLAPEKVKKALLVEEQS